MSSVQRPARPGAGAGDRACDSSLSVWACCPDKQARLLIFPSTSKGPNDFYQCELIFTSCILPRNYVLREKNPLFHLNTATYSYYEKIALKKGLSPSKQINLKG